MSYAVGRGTIEVMNLFAENCLAMPKGVTMAPLQDTHVADYAGILFGVSVTILAAFVAWLLAHLATRKQKPRGPEQRHGAP